MQLNEIENIISEINQIHLEFSEYVFEYLDSINLKKHSDADLEHVLKYRLHLHESINDYLMKASFIDSSFVYRVKTSESIIDKIGRFQRKEDSYPVNKWMNDIFGIRIIIEDEMVSEVLVNLECWKEAYSLQKFYERDKEGYKGIHLYFKNNSNFYYPWEMQIWKKSDVEGNIESHRKHKRNFI